MPVTHRARNSRSWLTTTIGRRSACMNSSSTSRPARSRSLVGSSSSRTSYWLSNTAARLTRARCPPDSAATGRSSTEPSRPSRAAVTGIRSSRSPPPSASHLSSASPYASAASSESAICSARESMMICASVTPVTRCRSSRTTSSSSDSISCRNNPTVASGGLTVTCPDISASGVPASAWSSVDFPAPLGPVRPQTSPVATTRSSPSNSVRAPRAAPTFLAVRVAIMTRPPATGRWCAGRSRRR